MIFQVNIARLLAGVAVAGLVTGCASSADDPDSKPQFTALERPRDIRPSSANDKAAAMARPATYSDSAAAATQDAPALEGGDELQQREGPKPFDERSRVSRVPRLADSPANQSRRDAVAAPAFVNERIDTRIPPEPLPRFIDVVFGELLNVPYVTGPGISERREVVQLRSSGEMNPETFLELVSVALKDYGVRITVENGVYQVLEDQALKARTPQFIKSRAKISTPVNLRPVVQFVELNAIDANDMASILRQALGRNNDSVAIESAQDSNFIILSGLPSDIETALEIIYQMDELDYAGTQVQRYSPAFWSVRELQTELRTLLEAEGWQASVSSNSPKTILMLAIDYSNDLMIFTRSKEARDRVNYWLSELDQPTPQGDVPELFVYNVQNLDAQLMAQTVNDVLSKTGGGAGGVGRPRQDIFSGEGLGAGGSFGARGAPGGGGNGEANTGLPSNAGGKKIVVDPLGNRLIYSGTASDYQRLLPLLKQLDRAPAEVLIEVTLADISLNQGLNYGVDWQFNNLGDPEATPRSSVNSSGENLFDNAVGSVIAGSGGVSSVVANNNVRASLQAAANNGDIRILSTPRIFARSGSVAQVQVGNDVPVLSSQATTNAEFGDGLLGVTQINYRSTGILLQIEPVVFGNNRIDLNISQELSNSTATSTAGVATPTFSNTSVSTALSLEDGQTAVIAGLIQESIDQTNSGVPFLKDIPIVGNLFKSTDLSESQREIVILITAYVLRGQDDKAAFVNEFSASFNRRAEQSGLVTLRPRNF